MPFYLKIDFLRKSDTKALTKGRSIKTLLADHPFCVIGPGAGTADLLGSVIDRLQVASDASKSRDLNRIRARVEIRAEFNNTFRNTARSIESWANGDMTKMENCGFDIRQVPRKGSVPNFLGAPALTVSHGPAEGLLLVDLGPVSGAAVWELQITAEDPSVEQNWVPFDRFAKRTKIRVTDRTPGQLYWLRARVFGVAGYGPWSTPVSIRSL